MPETNELCDEFFETLAELVVLTALTELAAELTGPVACADCGENGPEACACVRNSFQA